MESNNELDLVFICDCTGSMGSYLQAAQNSIEKIVTDIIKQEKCDVRFALVEYRDHPPQDNTFATRLTDFTTSLREMKEAVNRMSATGGGDGPESVSCAFDAALNLNYRESAAKIVVWIADAPPHCFVNIGDGFPNGCPCKKDLLEAVEGMKNKDIVVYSVGAEPLGFSYFRTLMRAVSEKTDGQYCALSSAEVLGELITYSSMEEIAMKREIEKFKKDIQSDEKFKAMSPEEKDKYIDNYVDEKMKTLNIKNVEVESIFENELPPIPDIFKTAANLQILKNEMVKEKDIEVTFKQAFRNTQQHSFGRSIRGRPRRSCDVDEMRERPTTKQRVEMKTTGNTMSQSDRMKSRTKKSFF